MVSFIPLLRDECGASHFRGGDESARATSLRIPILVGLSALASGLDVTSIGELGDAVLKVFHHLTSHSDLNLLESQIIGLSTEVVENVEVVFGRGVGLAHVVYLGGGGLGAKCPLTPLI